MESKRRWPTAVVKVGGSLFALPDLGPRLRKWLADRPLGEVLLVPGGGPVADVVRQYDRLHGLGEEHAHWLALSTMTVNAQFLVCLLPGAVIIPNVQSLAADRLPGNLSVLDPYAFARADEGQPGCLPHNWTVTSDSIAARAACVAGAEELVLLKSLSLPADMDWTEAAGRGFVDAYFPQVIGNLPRIRFINFRHGPAG